MANPTRSPARSKAEKLQSASAAYSSNGDAHMYRHSTQALVRHALQFRAIQLILTLRNTSPRTQNPEEIDSIICTEVGSGGIKYVPTSSAINPPTQSELPASRVPRLRTSGEISKVAPPKVRPMVGIESHGTVKNPGPAVCDASAEPGTAA